MYDNSGCFFARTMKLLIQIRVPLKTSSDLAGFIICTTGIKNYDIRAKKYNFTLISYDISNLIYNFMF